jgi:hypothetical protein
MATKRNDDIFNRPELARQVAQQLINPKALEIGFRSGLILSGIRRTGKTTFVKQDLIPALDNLGAIVVYVDLWSDALASPAGLVSKAVRKTLEDLQTPASTLLKRVSRVSGVDAGAFGFKFGFKLESVGASGGTTLAEAFKSVVDQANTDVVLIVDEVQHAINSDDGKNMLLALKAARDAINTRVATPGYFIFIGTGSHRAQLSELRSGRNQAFEGANSADYPLLGEDYVDHLLSRLRADGYTKLPSQKVAFDAFKTLGHRPEQMLRALSALNQRIDDVSDADAFLPVIASLLRSVAADSEFSKIDEMGELAKAVFSRIINQADGKGLYSKDAILEYEVQCGKGVNVDELQPIINALLSSNLVMRTGHGSYSVTDIQFKELWNERRRLLN